jgi:Flp pilus assembly protein TadG
MLVGETHRLSLWDNERNRRITDAVWTVSDPAIATVEAGDDATVTALVPGKVTVTATWQGLEAGALITVYPGTQLPPGTVKWSVKVSPGSKIAPAVPN